LVEVGAHVGLLVDGLLTPPTFDAFALRLWHSVTGPSLELPINHLSGSLSRRVSVRDAQGELEDLEKLVECVDSGRQRDQVAFYTVPVDD